MSDFDINVCRTYTNMVLSILYQFWHGEAVPVTEDSCVLPDGTFVRVSENDFLATAPLKNTGAMKLAESIRSTLCSCGFGTPDEVGSVMHFRCPDSRNYVSVCIVEETVAGKESAA